MSLEEYASVLPNLFSGHDEKGKGKVENGGQVNYYCLNALWDLTNTKCLVLKKEAIPKGPSKGFNDIVEYVSEGPGGRQTETIPFKKFQPKSTTANANKAATYQDYAIVLRRVWVQQQHGSSPIRLELEIHSQTLCKALRKMIVNRYENVDLQSFPIKIASPFCELFFYRDAIKALAHDETQPEDLRREMKLLHDFIRKPGLLSDIVNDYDKHIKEGRVMGDILWTIYPPNSLVVLKQGAIQECWICRNVYIMRNQGGTYWNVTGFRVGFDGVRPGMASQTYSVPMNGMHLWKLSELDLLPIEYCQDWEKTAALLVQRSLKLRNVLGDDLLGFRAQSYTGPAWNNDFSSYQLFKIPTADRVQITGRFMVDFSQYISNHRWYYCTLEDFRKKPKKAKLKLPRGHFRSESDSEAEDAGAYDAELPSESLRGVPKKEDLSQLCKEVAERFHIKEQDFDLLYPALVPCFWLGEKRWIWLRSDELQDVAWNTNAFEFLRLEPLTKDLIESLVKGHESGSISFDDVIDGKGQGLIFLLHGEPGLGKTLTAESVADYLQRPLYSVTGGELSTAVDRVEERLNSIFELTKRWNAVSLLDEADVLLCKRNSAEMDRNAVVAVFLRKLEYFQGVLFLTTNRKDDFDDAFKSRIHVTITYPALSPASQSAIWRNLIKKNRVQTDDSWTDEVFSELGHLSLNGRTIKNLLRTASAYARADGGKLAARHALAMVKTELSEDSEDNHNLTDSEKRKRAERGRALATLERIVQKQKLASY